MRASHLLPLVACFLASAAVKALQDQAQHHFSPPSTFKNDDWPQLSPFIPHASRPPPQQRPKVWKVAIIGAGPSGTSAAYFLHQAQKILDSEHRLGDPEQIIDITVFEKETRIGGRTTVVHPYDDQRFRPVEVGASIFAAVNYNLLRAVKKFKLETTSPDLQGSTGIWDGQQFLFEGDTSSWWSSAKMLWRYGYSPVSTQNLVKKALKSFVALYSPKFLHSPSGQANRTVSGFPWETIEEMSQAVNTSSLTPVTAMDYYYENSVSKLFIEEMIEAATRVNYAQNTDEIHAFGGLVSLASSGARAVVGGNYQIFERMLAESGARVRMGEQGDVTGLLKFDSIRGAIEAGKITEGEASDNGWYGGGKDEAKWWLGTKSGFGDVYDVVLIATPWHNAGITLLNTDKRIASPPYARVCVTLFSTTAKSARPDYFGRGKNDDVPTTILTSYESVRRAIKGKGPVDPSKGDKEDGDKKEDGDEEVKGGRVSEQVGEEDLSQAFKSVRSPRLDFNSINFIAPLSYANGTLVEDADGQQGNEKDPRMRKQKIVKIFSPQPIDDEKLHEIFDEESIGWVYRKEWDAYPLLTPTESFQGIRVDENLYFVDAMEKFISTMETSTVSARNTVGLILKDWFGDDFVNGGDDCPWDGKEKGQANPQVNEGEEEDIGNDNEGWDSWGCKSG
ncbi:hypothetical protein IE53DRAFT_384552 [Violaceomyces palustris]|uniref:Uncharacterized protein n=1 Tax=Violaceomyces palustris TaxID=1673888 RepID=A0ACD0P4K8_9BASI|nr:hypothetical protein IE53DRAFT_384552 [Violaceomyces palustris]